jgi:anti-sigma factor RsiW
MTLRHPSRRALQDWLAGTAASDIARHLSTCQRCAATLEQLDSTAGLAGGGAPATPTAPPSRLAERLDDRAAARLPSRQILDVVAGIFAAGIETTRLLLIEDTDDDD